ncbi:MAG: AraC family transcriptional regulator [Lachnospiraceae bacterium]|nr:AraC family transcriptional regulator [Lachnospiraceae bacterium]
MNKTFSVKIEYGGSFLARLHVSSEKGASRWTEDRHCNAGYELHYCLGGHAVFICDRVQYEMERGDVVLAAPGIYHSSEGNDPGLLHISITLCQPDFQAEKMLMGLIGTSRTFKMNSQLLELCEFLLSEERGEADEAMLISLMTSVTISTLRQLGAAGKGTEQVVLDNRFRRTDIIDNFFEEHFMENGAEEQLAETMGLSRRQLMRVISEEYGESYREKLLSARMDKAALLLRNSKLSVSEVCAAVGYTSETAFFKQFRKKFAFTPAEYRDKMRQKLCN